MDKFRRFLVMERGVSGDLARTPRQELLCLDRFILISSWSNYLK